MAIETRIATQTKITSVRLGPPPGPAGFPLVGNLPRFRRDPLAFVRGVHLAYGDVATVRMLNDRQVIMFFRPEHAHYFLVDHARNFTSGSDRYIMKRFLGEGLLTTDGEQHRQHRRMVQPAFHKKRVEGYAEIMTAQTLELMQRWRVGEEHDIARALQELTLRIVVKALFNLDYRSRARISVRSLPR
jgi:cytochrome P450